MARDPFSSMWEDACELLYQAEQRQRRFFRRSGSALRRAAWQPPIDVFETADTISVLVALPGVAPSQLQVVLDTGALFVRGERSFPEMTGAGRIRRLEIPHGCFERCIDLPPGHYELLHQELQHGCLLLQLRKRTHTRE
ncbi:MAG: Hsp20/alpha crystallin family protein [Thiogranum sp.]|nr:Hsp20/alpha crystallin family protein [Thiogranum sp.]